MVHNTKMIITDDEWIVQFWGMRGKKKSLLKTAVFAPGDMAGVQAAVISEVEGRLPERALAILNKRRNATIN